MKNFKNLETKFSLLINENYAMFVSFVIKNCEQNYRFCSNMLILDCNSKI